MDAGAGLLLASGSQDSYIRIWKLKRTTTLAAGGTNQPKLSFRERALMETTTVFTVQPLEPEALPTTWSVELEALLLGHDGWVYVAHGVCCLCIAFGCRLLCAYATRFPQLHLVREFICRISCAFQINHSPGILFSGIRGRAITNRSCCCQLLWIVP
jgi:hypothetical protein